MEYSLFISVRVVIETMLNIGTDKNHLIDVPNFMALFVVWR